MFLDYESRLWKRLMKNKYYRRFHNHVFYLYYYDDYIRRNYCRQQMDTATINSSSNRRKKINDNDDYDQLKLIDYNQIDYDSNVPLRRSFWNCIVPGIISLIQTFGAGLYALSPSYFQQYSFIGTFARFNPPEGREYFLTAWAIAAISVVIMMFICIPTRARQFRFVRILFLNKNDRHRLTNEEFEQFERSRDRILSAVRSFILTLVLVFPFGFLPTIIQLEAYKISMFWTVIWFIIINTNTWYLFMTQFYFPIFLFMIQFYFRMRLRNLQKRLLRLQQRFHRYNHFDSDSGGNVRLNQQSKIWRRQINNEFLRINRLYVELRREIYSNSNQLRRFVTTIFLDLSMQSTYLISIVLFTRVAPAITWVIMQITTGITTMLLIFLFSCSMLEFEDRKFFNQKQKCLNIGNVKRNIFTSKNSIKLDTPIEQTVGFTIIHDITINSELSVTVLLILARFSS
ncbi:uncharacterized protein LOC124500626 [Dermatophagoides farinae]|uniref:uncharacterized protein LOC124500626 n=1 Tax=Dermatophagoides farinae TaxID=6954 RepID=UPI003F627EB5